MRQCCVTRMEVGVDDKCSFNWLWWSSRLECLWLRQSHNSIYDEHTQDCDIANSLDCFLPYVDISRLSFCSHVVSRLSSQSHHSQLQIRSHTEMRLSNAIARKLQSPLQICPTKCCIRRMLTVPQRFDFLKDGREDSHNIQWIFLSKLNMKAKLC